MTISSYLEEIKTNLASSTFNELCAGLRETYFRPGTEYSLAEWHLYGSSRLGIYQANKQMATYYDSTLTTITYQTRIQYRTNGSRRFELSNHLGNVLVTVSDKRIAICTVSETVAYYKAEIITASDYYSFGSVMENRSYEADTLGYRFGWNGKPTDEEVNGQGNTIVYEARIFDSRTGRFYSTDPREKEYAWQSTYVYFSNSPIAILDFLGKGGTIEEIDDGTPKDDIANGEGLNLKKNPLWNDPTIANQGITPVTNMTYSKIENAYKKNGQGIVNSQESLEWARGKDYNTCAIKLSYALNKAGYKIPTAQETPMNVKVQNGTVADVGNFILTAEDMANYLRDIEPPTLTFKIASAQDVNTMLSSIHKKYDDVEGIIAIIPDDATAYEATGHVDLVYEDIMWDISLYGRYGLDIGPYLKKGVKKTEFTIYIWVLNYDK